MQIHTEHADTQSHNPVKSFGTRITLGINQAHVTFLYSLRSFCIVCECFILKHALVLFYIKPVDLLGLIKES